MASVKERAFAADRAMKDKKYDEAIQIIRENPDVVAWRHTDGRSIVESAASWGADPVLVELISLGADIRADDKFGMHTPLVIALEHRNWSTARILVEAGAQLDTLNFVPAAMWAHEHDEETMREMLYLGMEPFSDVIYFDTSDEYTFMLLQFGGKLPDKDAPRLNKWHKRKHPLQKERIALEAAVEEHLPAELVALCGSFVLITPTERALCTWP